MDPVVDFLTYKDNKKNIIGIIGCGNRNFNDLFAQTAKKIAATLKVPILYLLEFSGTNQDVKNVRKIVHDLSAGQSVVFEDFFYYTNDHSLNKFKEIK